MGWLVSQPRVWSGIDWRAVDTLLSALLLGFSSAFRPVWFLLPAHAGLVPPRFAWHPSDRLAVYLDSQDVNINHACLDQFLQRAVGRYAEAWLAEYRYVQGRCPASSR